MKNGLLMINMSDSTFSEMKGDLTIALQKCLTEMERADSDSGTVTLKISITKDKVPVTTETEYRDADKPTFKWKAESNVPMKSAYEGELSGDFELTKEGNTYAMKPISGQTSIFDTEEDEDEYEDEEDENG